MYQITNISNDYKQNIEWITESGESVYIYLEYKPNQLGWFVTIKYSDNEFKNLRLVNHFNMLRSYKSYLPFGLACTTEDGLEPMGVEDFTSGYATVFMLTRQECNIIESECYEKV